LNSSFTASGLAMSMLVPNWNNQPPEGWHTALCLRFRKEYHLLCTYIRTLACTPPNRRYRIAAHRSSGGVFLCLRPDHAESLSWYLAQCSRPCANRFCSFSCRLAVSTCGHMILPRKSLHKYNYTD